MAPFDAATVALARIAATGGVLVLMVGTAFLTAGPTLMPPRGPGRSLDAP
jgi:hypothetical protein